MEEDIIYNDVVKIERADETEAQKLKRLQEEQMNKKNRQNDDPFADLNFEDDY